MLWLVPHLFADPRLLDAALPGLSLPGLTRLFARGQITHDTPTGTEAALARACGVTRQRDWPVAPYTRLADGSSPDEATWLRADPAHFALLRDRVVVTNARFDDLSADEAASLTASLAAHFGADFAPLALHPQRWYLRFALPPQLHTTPPSLAYGRALDRVLPVGDDAARWRARLNEAQMLLHTHPVNLAREARGTWPVNGIWLWGGGTHVPVGRKGGRIHARGAAAELAQALGCTPRDVPAAWSPRHQGGADLVVLDTLETVALQHDALGWREALRALDADWFAPLAHALGQIDANGLSIVDPIAGRSLILQGRDAWKFWRRPVRLESVLSLIHI